MNNFFIRNSAYSPWGSCCRVTRPRPGRRVRSGHAQRCNCQPRLRLPRSGIAAAPVSSRNHAAVANRCSGPILDRWTFYYALPHAAASRRGSRTPPPWRSPARGHGRPLAASFRRVLLARRAAIGCLHAPPGPATRLGTEGNPQPVRLERGLARGVRDPWGRRPDPGPLRRYTG